MNKGNDGACGEDGDKGAKKARFFSQDIYPVKKERGAEEKKENPTRASQMIGMRFEKDYSFQRRPSENPSEKLSDIFGHGGKETGEMRLSVFSTQRGGAQMVQENRSPGQE